MVTDAVMIVKLMFRDPRLSRMAAFLGLIGIDLRAGLIDVPTLFPRSLISGGSLVVVTLAPAAPVESFRLAGSQRL